MRLFGFGFPFILGDIRGAAPFKACPGLECNLSRWFFFLGGEGGE